MDANAERLEFVPPHEPAAIRAFTLAVFAHLLLAAALTWGISWNKEVETVSAEAELWAAVPQQAAPAPAPQAVVTPPAPVPEPAPVPAPAPVPKVETPPPAPPVAVDPDIAIEREKRKQQLAKQRAAEELEVQKKLDAKKLADKQKREEAEREKQQLIAEQKAEKKAAEKAAEKALQEKQRKDDLAKEKANEKTTAAMRQQAIDRMRKLAGADPSSTGDANTGTGTARKASGPSAAYGARIAARIRPYIRHPQEVPGNPPVEIEVKTSPDGTIVDQRVVKSSGNPAWDESAIRAVIAATTLPRNEEGRVISPIIVILRQRDQ